MTTRWILTAFCMAAAASCLGSARMASASPNVCVKAGKWTTRADNHDLIDLQQQGQRAQFAFPRPILENIQIGEERLVFYSTIPARRAGMLRGRYHLEGGTSGFELRLFRGRALDAVVTTSLRSNENSELFVPLRSSPSGWQVSIRTVARGETTGWMQDFRICSR